jgi:hypothetical protein
MPVETILCGACQARVTPDLVTPPELHRLRSSFSRAGTGVRPIEDDAAPVPCPWCGVGELRITDVTEEDDRSTVFYYPLSRPRSPDATLVVNFNSASKHEYCVGSNIEITPGDPDYGLWYWICKRNKRFEKVTSDELPMIRDEFRQWERGWFPWAWHRLTHRRRCGWMRSGREE